MDVPRLDPWPGLVAALTLAAVVAHAVHSNWPAIEAIVATPQPRPS